MTVSLAVFVGKCYRRWAQQVEN